MASVLRCDRCGHVYEKNVTHPYKTGNCGTVLSGMCLVTRNEYHVEEMDLCDECIDKLNRFLGGVELDEPECGFLD
jgi:hypothetical protein